MKQAMAELTQETIDGIKAKLVKGAEQAAQTLLKISSSDEINPTVFYAARDILDRIGLKAGAKWSWWALEAIRFRWSTILT